MTTRWAGKPVPPQLGGGQYLDATGLPAAMGQAGYQSAGPATARARPMPQPGRIHSLCPGLLPALALWGPLQ